MNTSKYRVHGKAQFGAINPQLAVGLAGIAVVLVAVIAYMMYAGEEQATLTTPPPSPPPPVTSKQARPDDARTIIKKLKQQESPDYALALEKAREFSEAGQLADAQLIYFFAARGGYAPAAYELGEMHDPLYFDISNNLMDKADPFQAYRWYHQAQQAGHEEAAERLSALQSWANEAAANGDAEAERLLLQWE